MMIIIGSRKIRDPAGLQASADGELHLSSVSTLISKLAIYLDAM
jgi:hypothetical protein